VTPGARIAAAVEILDAIATGSPAEKALTSWARGARFAGSGDRAAVRDHVFQTLRCLRSHACRGGGETGRARMIGALRDEGRDPATLFTGQGHAPAQLTVEEAEAGLTPTGNVACDMPDWLMPRLEASLGANAISAAMALRKRAPVMLRVNLRKTNRANAIAALEKDDVSVDLHPIAKTALIVTNGARRVGRSEAYLSGLVELQDGASQAAMETIDLTGVTRVLDYCAGGGGKSLALAARADAEFFAHDIAPERMKDLPDRAARAGVRITSLSTSSLPSNAPYSLVLCDVPCSGSGTWRRAPDAKWRLTPERLAALCGIQGGILDEAAALIDRGGRLVYATCSLLREENERQIEAFLGRRAGWSCVAQHRFDVSDGGDGFFVAQLTRE
jgi:16S rRNA (cytosine967-C5)-methyltransferase